MQKKRVCTPERYNSGMHVECAVQLVMMAWIACLQAAELWNLQNSLQVYVFFNNGIFF